MKKKTTTMVICENFNIPSQTIFQDYKCSYKSGLTYFGRLYIGEEHICFIANMFGLLKKCVIQIHKITRVEEPLKNNLLIQVLDSTEYVFHGFKSDHAFKLIKALWAGETIEPDVLNSHEDDQESFQLPGHQINKEKLLDEGNVQSSFFNPKAVEADRQKLCQFQLPCSVEQYYVFFLADDCTVYPRKRHLELRDSKEIVVGNWKESEELDSEIKELSALIRVTGVPFLNYAHMHQVWKMKRNQNKQVFLDIVTQMGDVPYSNYFVVNTFMTILKDGDTKCRMVVEMSIVFNKSTYMKGKILSKTITDMNEDFEFWFAQVKSILTKMRKSQEAEAKNSNSARTSANIEFQTNVPIVGSQRQLSPLKKSVNQQMEAGQTVDKIQRLEGKIENLSKLVKVLLILVFLQVFLNFSWQFATTQSQHYQNRKDTMNASIFFGKDRQTQPAKDSFQQIEGNQIPVSIQSPETNSNEEVNSQL